MVILCPLKEQACKNSVKTQKINLKRRKVRIQSRSTLMKYVPCCLKTIFLLTLTLEIVIKRQILKRDQ